MQPLFPAPPNPTRPHPNSLSAEDPQDEERMMLVEYSQVRRLSGSQREAVPAEERQPEELGLFAVPLGEETVVLELQFELPEDSTVSNGQQV